MKITKETEEFKPITITLETREEADTLWHCLNIANGKTWSQYCESTDIMDLEKNKSYFFNILDEVHRPSKY